MLYYKIYYTITIFSYLTIISNTVSIDFENSNISQKLENNKDDNLFFFRYELGYSFGKYNIKNDTYVRNYIPNLFTAVEGSIALGLKVQKNTSLYLVDKFIVSDSFKAKFAQEPRSIESGFALLGVGFGINYNVNILDNSNIREYLSASINYESPMFKIDKTNYTLNTATTEMYLPKHGIGLWTSIGMEQLVSKYWGIGCNLNFHFNYGQNMAEKISHKKTGSLKLFGLGINISATYN